MDQSSFFTSLEYRLCGHLSEMRYRGWCDGFELEELFDTGRAIIARGHTWMMDVAGERGDEPWPFRLRVAERPDNDWSEIEAVFEVDWEECTVIVRCGRAGTDFANQDIDCAQDVVDYLTFRNIPAELYEAYLGASVTIARGTSQELRLLQHVNGWEVQQAGTGGLLFGTWKEACDYGLALLAPVE